MASTYEDDCGMDEVVPAAEISPAVKFGREVVELALDYYKSRYGMLDYRTNPSKKDNKQLFRLSAVLMRREGRNCLLL